LDPDLTHICTIGWNHGGPTPRQRLTRGLLIAFDRPVRNGDIHRHSFIVLQSDFNPDLEQTCWCEMNPETLTGVRFPNDCDISEQFEIVTDPNDLVNGARFLPARPFNPNFEYRVIVKGDFIRDVDGRGVDANHLPPWLPARITGDWVEGGTFESWFTLEGRQIDINRASLEEFIALPGVGRELAEAIMETRRASGRFNAVDDLLNVSGIGQRRLAQLRDLLRV
jgi:competence ComEA-like helix-hairpin-helix protein